MAKTYRIYKEGTSMKGPHKLDNTTIDANLTDEDFGVYVLTKEGAKGGIIVVYVGRGNLKDRLSKHAKAKDGTDFYYKFLKNEEAAFTEECRLYREYGKTEHLDNLIAPALPEGSKQSPCD